MDPPRPRTQQRRQTERYQPSDLRCDLGDVVDISRSGLRLRAEGSLGETGRLLTMTLKPADETGTLRLTGHIVWQKRTGLRCRLVGVAFVQLRPGIAQALDTLARTGSLAGAPKTDDASAWGEDWQAYFSDSTPQADCRAVLQVSADASWQEIQASYRRLARQCHPDRTGDASTQAEFIRITRAYESLRAALTDSPTPRRKAG